MQKTKWFYEVHSGTWREIIRARVGCPKDAEGVRWAYMPPGILLPLGLVNTSVGGWVRVKLARFPGRAKDQDIFFIEKVFYCQLMVEESKLDVDQSTGSPELLKTQQYTCPSSVVTGGYRSITNCGSVNGKPYNVPRTKHRRGNAGSNDGPASYHH